MDKKFLRRTLLVRTILQHNGKLKRSEIIKLIEKSFKAYSDIEHLRMDNYSVSTFDKDKKSIRDSWKIDLDCNNEIYSIDPNFEGIFQNDLLNSVIFLSSMNEDMMLPGYVMTETRKNTGIENFHAISEAIEKKNQITISYFDYISEQEKIKSIMPYRLKQKDFKWYVLAQESGDDRNDFKSFALERIGNIKPSGTFKPKEIDFNAPYQDAIGMFTNGEPEKIIVEYDHRDGHYLKANPIHHSQKVISENKNQIRFEFSVKPNEDFIMELLRRTWSVKIIEPQSLKKKLINFWKEALERNEN